MQVTAYTIARLFGIEALGNFYNEANSKEIEQCRLDYALVAKKQYVIKSFNDGNNCFDVVFDPMTMLAWRNDHHCDVTAMYAADCMRLLSDIVQAKARISTQ